MNRKKEEQIQRIATVTKVRTAIAIFKIALLLVAGWGITVPAFAQCAVKEANFPINQQIKYDLSFHWQFVWFKAGSAKLSFDKTEYAGNPANRINLLAVGNSRADLFFKLRDTLTSVMSERLEPLYYRKGAVEGKRYWVDEATFSYEDGVSKILQSRTEEKKGTKEYSFTDSRCVYDLLSVLVWARTLNPDSYSAGDRIQIPVATGRRIDEQVLIYRGRDTYKAENKVTYNCLIFSLLQEKKGVEQEVITFTITDDANRIPVCLNIFLKFGLAKASMIEVSGSEYPLTSIVSTPPTK
nr:DUF3108 domain-containing protein [Bacteroides sp. 214]